MTIKEYKKYYVYCDFCDGLIGTFDTKEEAVTGKQRYGAVSKKIDGEWQDICEDCYENGIGKKD